MNTYTSPSLKPVPTVFWLDNLHRCDESFQEASPFIQKLITYTHLIPLAIQYLEKFATSFPIPPPTTHYIIRAKLFLSFTQTQLITTVLSMTQIKFPISFLSLSTHEECCVSKCISTKLPVACPPLPQTLGSFLLYHKTNKRPKERFATRSSKPR